MVGGWGDSKACMSIYEKSPNSFHEHKSFNTFIIINIGIIRQVKEEAMLLGLSYLMSNVIILLLHGYPS